LLWWQTNKKSSANLAPLSFHSVLDSTTAQQNQLMADLIPAETSREGAVTGSTLQNHAWSWRQFTKYLGTIGIGQNIFLDSFTRSQQNKIIGAFAMALQKGWFSSAAHDTLALGTIWNTILNKSATFRKNGWPNPTKDNNLQLSCILQCKFWAYKYTNPKEHQQKAIPAFVIAKTTKQKLMELQCAILHLTILVFIFAMRLCKYVKVQQQEKQQTKILRLRNLQFFKNGWLVNHHDPSIKFANLINISFKLQKKDKKNAAVIHMSSGDVTLCPVRAAATSVRRIWSYPGANDDIPISTIWQYNRIKHITFKQIKNVLRDAVLTIGEDTLHIAADEIGSHSIHLGAAMAMFLGGCPMFLIMIISCWFSDTFLRYIRKQVKELNHNVSRKMITHMFHRHIPNYTSPTVSHLDPRQCNHPDNIKTWKKVGGDMAWQARLPAFTQFNWALQ
jgi:hypothetical protein